MSTFTRRTINGITVVLALALLLGACARTPKQPAGAQVLAEKGISSPGLGGEDAGSITRPPMSGAPIPLSQLADPSEFPGICDRIHFDYDRYNIRPEFTTCLDQVAAYMIRHPEYVLLIEGHCDERGTMEYNMTLGENRAQSTASYVIQRGLPANRIVTKSYGESQPLALGHDESAWRLNRRCEFFGVPSAGR